MTSGMIKRLYAVLVLALSLGAGGTSTLAQNMAPGPALPGNVGGIGPGGTEIAPGPATGGDSMIEQEGPGGVPLARGSSIATQAHRHHHTFHHANRTHRSSRQSGL
jgi:hypothetical protein